ncbi:tropomyosin-like [Nicotiana tomentosiformis]|uniref:tropomyosin-like n=1 Tax=Nicotiana tomentosiformis TaxID=4098 RepID=UPI00388C8D0B
MAKTSKSIPQKETPSVSRLAEKENVSSAATEETVQKKLDQIEQVQAKVDTVKVEAEEWKRNMDILASEKETARAQLASTEAQLRGSKEKASVQSKKIEEIQTQLSSVVSGQETFAKELEAAKSEVAMVKAEADERVAQYKADAEAS